VRRNHGPPFGLWRRRAVFLRSGSSPMNTASHRRRVSNPALRRRNRARTRFFNGLLRVEEAEDGRAVVVRFRRKELRDPRLIRRIDFELQQVMEKYKARRIVVDFDNVSGAVSFLFGAVLQMGAAAEEQKREVRICCLSRELETVFGMLNAQSVVPVCATRQDALGNIRKSGRWWRFGGKNP
jgi:anti-anti-sigma regulatory factor